MKTVIDFLLEDTDGLPDDFRQLLQIAKTFDDPHKFNEHLDWRILGHNRELSFLGERFRRLNRGTRLTGVGKCDIFRTGDSPIVWGDYIYNNRLDAEHALSVGQGNKLYSKTAPCSDIVETSIPGEFYYSPKNLARIGNDLIDLWYYANGKENPENQTVATKIKPDKKFFEEFRELLGNDSDKSEDHRYELYDQYPKTKQSKYLISDATTSKLFNMMNGYK
jgi:hypothetical protein